MKSIKILFLFCLFCVKTILYASESEECYKTIINQFKNLELLVGRPLAWPEKHQIKIESTNTKGETIGWADFKNSDQMIGNEEKIAWYWHPEKGFAIIASQNALLDTYGKDHQKPFQFYEMFINDSGIVVFSFLVDQKGYNVCPWLWWSLDEGLHLSEEPTSYQLVRRLNDTGYVLIKEFILHPGFRFHIKHFKDEDDLYTYEFDPRSELTPFTGKIGSRLPPGFQKNLNEMILKYNIHVNHALNFDWAPFIVDEFSDNLNIKGHARVTAKFIEGEGGYIFWHVYIRYEICEGYAKFIIEKITEAFKVNPRRFTDLDNKIIFEKNFSDSNTRKAF